MKAIDYQLYIKENPVLFYSFILLMILIIAITIYLVYKELKKKK